jgi:hypothetical protein
MRALIAVGALIAATFITAPRAEAATWCYDGEQGVTCGFVSLQQCLEALSATSTGTCSFDPLIPTRETVRTQPRKRSAN